MLYPSDSQSTAISRDLVSAIFSLFGVRIGSVKKQSTGLRGISASKSFQFRSHLSDATPYRGPSQHCSSFRGVIYTIYIHRPGIYLKRLITPDQLRLHPTRWLLLSPFTLTHYISATLHPPRLPILVSRVTEVRAHLTLRVTPAAVATNQPKLATPSERAIIFSRLLQQESSHGFTITLCCIYRSYKLNITLSCSVNICISLSEWLHSPSLLHLFIF